MSRKWENKEVPFTTGLREDPVDKRDYVFSAKGKLGGISGYTNVIEDLPQTVDRSSEMSPVKNQGYAGTCVGFATAAVKEWQETQEYINEKKRGSKHERESGTYDLSEAWIYWNCKKIDPWPGESGTNIRSAMKVLRKIGVPSEKAWPYTDDESNPGKPTPWSKMTARWKKIKSYYKIQNIEDLLVHLANTGPVITGMLLYQDFYYPESDGFVPLPSSNESPIGAHAVAICGYIKEKDHNKLIIKNSWGPNWGDNGYGLIKWKYWWENNLNTWGMTDQNILREDIEGPYEELSR